MPQRCYTNWRNQNKKNLKNKNENKNKNKWKWHCFACRKIMIFSAYSRHTHIHTREHCYTHACMPGHICKRINVNAVAALLICTHVRHVYIHICVIKCVCVCVQIFANFSTIYFAALLLLSLSALISAFSRHFRAGRDNIFALLLFYVNFNIVAVLLLRLLWCWHFMNFYFSYLCTQLLTYFFVTSCIF